MIKHVHDCVGCPDGVECQKSICPYWNATELICDHCGDSVDVLYWVDNEQWCTDCVLDIFDEVDAE